MILSFALLFNIPTVLAAENKTDSWVDCTNINTVTGDVAQVSVDSGNNGLRVYTIAGKNGNTVMNIACKKKDISLYDYIEFDYYAEATAMGDWSKIALSVNGGINEYNTGINTKATWTIQHAKVPISQLGAELSAVSTIQLILYGSSMWSVDFCINNFKLTVDTEKNVFLDDISVFFGESKLSISPVFEPTVTDYTVNVPLNITSVTINATAQSMASAFDKSGIWVKPSNGIFSQKVSLTSNDKTINIKVRSSDKSKVISYKVTIKRTEAITNATINATAYGNGTISPSGNTVVQLGDNQSYVITPNSGYLVKNVVVDGVSVGAVSSYTFSGVVEAHTIVAYFEALPTGNVIWIPCDDVSQVSGDLLASVFRYGYGLQLTTIENKANSKFTFKGKKVATDNYKFIEFDVYAEGPGLRNWPSMAISVDGSSKSYATNANLSIDWSSVHIKVPIEEIKGDLTSFSTMNLTLIGNCQWNVEFCVNNIQLTNDENVNANLSALTIDGGEIALSPIFDSSVTEYTTRVPESMRTVTLKAVAQSSIATINCNGKKASGELTSKINLQIGKNVLEIEVLSADKKGRIVYKITVDCSGYEPIKQYVTVNVIGKGSASPSGRVGVTTGGTQAFFFTAEKGYHIKCVKVDGKPTCVENYYELENVRSAHTIEVEFCKQASGDILFTDLSDKSKLGGNVKSIECMGQNTVKITTIPNTTNPVFTFITDSANFNEYDYLEFDVFSEGLLTDWWSFMFSLDGTNYVHNRFNITHKSWTTTHVKIPRGLFISSGTPVVSLDSASNFSVRLNGTSIWSVYFNIANIKFTTEKSSLINHQTNAQIDSLTVMGSNGYSYTRQLSPNFNSNFYNYKLQVPMTSEKITIDGNSVSPLAFIEGLGDYKLQKGLNMIKLKVTAYDKTVQYYIINVVKGQVNTSFIDTCDSESNSLFVPNGQVNEPFGVDNTSQREGAGCFSVNAHSFQLSFNFDPVDVEGMNYLCFSYYVENRSIFADFKDIGYSISSSKDYFSNFYESRCPRLFLDCKPGWNEACIELYNGGVLDHLEPTKLTYMRFFSVVDCDDTCVVKLDNFRLVRDPDAEEDYFAISPLTMDTSSRTVSKTLMVASAVMTCGFTSLLILKKKKKYKCKH